MLKLTTALTLLLLTPAIAFANGDEMTRTLHQQAEISNLDICHSGGCADISNVALSQEEWQQVVAIFTPLPATAELERKAIAQSIGVLETLVGAKTGTSGDRGGTFGNSAYPGQMDCNDEAINSTNYMKLMQQAGLLQFHQVGDIHRRGFFFKGWPHSTASIRESASGELFAVDSWFHDNGVAAEIMPLPQWKSGWRPANSDAH